MIADGCIPRFFYPVHIDRIWPRFAVSARAESVGMGWDADRVIFVLYRIFCIANRLKSATTTAVFAAADFVVMASRIAH